MQARAQTDFTLVEESGFLEGYVELNGERWRARSADGKQRFVSGERLSVVGREGLILVVSHDDRE
jgi:membrane-bound ClpP family serine protease